GTGFGASLGYLTSPKLLIYSGYAYYSYSLNYEINHEASRDGASPAANYKGAQKGAAESAAVGLEFLGESNTLGLSVQHDWRYWEVNSVSKDIGVTAFAKILF